MVFTGDIHGCIDRFYDGSLAHVPPGGYLVVCGDFSFVWGVPGTELHVAYKQRLRELSALPYTILFADGNHENFDVLEEYPVEVFCGGRVHRIAENILHLMRGQVYDIEGLRLFVMGGAYSRDRYRRREGVSWFPRELPDNEEYREATANLSRVDWQVDVVVTHTAPTEIIRQVGGVPDAHDRELTGFFSWLAEQVRFRHWFFGHWHVDRILEGGFRALYFDTETVLAQAPAPSPGPENGAKKEKTRP